MQDTYAFEKLAIGDWEDIGYGAPGEFVNSSAYESKSISYSGANDKGLIKIETSGNEDCLALTPSFETFSRATAR